MVEILPGSDANVVGLKVSGKLLHQDYQTFIPLLEEAIAKHGSARCLIEMVDLHGIELKALWDELKFDTKHCRDIQKCAVVGDRSWEKWATNLSKPMFPSAQMRYFDVSEIDAAWKWIKE